MMAKSRFKIVNIATLSDRKVVVVEQLDGSDYRIEPGMFLGNVEILEFDIPRIVDVNGKQKLNVHAFWVEDFDQMAVGDELEINKHQND